MLSSHEDPLERARLSGWIREQNDSGIKPVISSDDLKNIFARPLPSVAERANRLLMEAARGQKALGERCNIQEGRFLAVTYSAMEGDVFFLAELLQEQGMVGLIGMGGAMEIKPFGYVHLDEITRQPSESNRGFVAMWFAPEMDSALSSGFFPAIAAAGYDPIQMSREEHINKIDDEIVAQIRASRFVVADFTGHRGGVYFEAGFAMGLGIPVIWTCRKDDLANLHFDIRQYNCIDWETPADLAKRLQYRIEAVIGPGPKKPLE